jgi:hypothetical protein
MAVNSCPSAVHFYRKGNSGKEWKMFKIIRIPSDVVYLVPLHHVGDYLVIGGRCGRMWLHSMVEEEEEVSLNLASHSTELPSPKKKAKTSTDSTVSTNNSNSNRDSVSVQLINLSVSDCHPLVVHAGQFYAISLANSLIVSGFMQPTSHYSLRPLLASKSKMLKIGDDTSSSSSPVQIVEGLDDMIMSTIVTISCAEESDSPSNLVTNFTERKANHSHIVLHQSLFRLLFDEMNRYPSMKVVIVQANRDGSLYWWPSPNATDDDDEVCGVTTASSGLSRLSALPLACLDRLSNFNHPIISLLGVGGTNHSIKSSNSSSSEKVRLDGPEGLCCCGLLLVSASGWCRLITLPEHKSGQLPQGAPVMTNELCSIDFDVGLNIKSACIVLNYLVLLTIEGKVYTIPLYQCDLKLSSHIDEIPPLVCSQPPIIFSPTPLLKEVLPFPQEVVSLTLQVVLHSKFMMLLIMKSGKVVGVDCDELRDSQKWILRSINHHPSSSSSSSSCILNEENVDSYDGSSSSTMSRGIDLIDGGDVIEVVSLPRGPSTLSHRLRLRLTQLNESTHQLSNSIQLRDGILEDIDKMSRSMDMIANIRHHAKMMMMQHTRVLNNNNHNNVGTISPQVQKGSHFSPPPPPPLNSHHLHRTCCLFATGLVHEVYVKSFQESTRRLVIQVTFHTCVCMCVLYSCTYMPIEVCMSCVVCDGIEIYIYIYALYCGVII